MKKPNSNSKPPENRALNLLAASVDVEAAPPEGEAQKLRRFTMTAYTGGAMQLVGWRYPVVVDLQGLQMGRQRRPILLDHTRDVDFVMGQTDSIAVMNDQLVVAGQVMGDSPKARQVIALNDKGFGWQASIGARAEQVEFVAEGKTSIANGREFAGPVNIARRATLGEISFVVLGADDNTSAQIAASADQPRGTEDMDFTKWLESQGFSTDALNENQTKSLRAMYDSQATKPAEPAPSPAATIRAEAAAEAKRIAAIRKVCAGKHGDLEAQAIEEGWDTTRAELEVLRASRPQGPALQSGKPLQQNVIEAALCRRIEGMTEERLARWYDERTLNEALSLGKYGLHALMFEVIHAAGRHATPGIVDGQTIRTALEADRSLRAAAGGYSTISLTGILSNVANKSMLAAYNAVESVAPLFCAQRDVNDFKQVTRYRMTGQGTFEKVGPDGELKHAQLTEESFTNQIDTYGKIISLTRVMIINDDLEGFLGIPSILGRQAALAVESAVFTLLLSNPSSFFGSGNKNYQSGAGTALQISSLTTAEQLFLDQTDKDGKPILLSPAILLVPTALKVTAQQLMTETRVNETTTADKPKPANNPHAGKWQPHASPYLNSQGISGSSATAWYLFANPADVAAMEIAYLRGQRTPTIESSESDFDNLGMKWRGYFDFGVAMQDFRAAVKSAGA